MENCGLGAENQVLLAQLTASAAVATLPAGNLTSQQGSASYAWRVPATEATLTLDFASVAPVRAVSVHRTNLMPAASWTVTCLNGDAVVWSQSGAMNVVSGQALCILPPGISGNRVTIAISDPGNPDGFLSIPLMYVGDLWQPVRNFSTDSTSSFALGVDEATALSGAEFPQHRWTQRKLSIAHQSYGAAEVAVLQQIQRVAATGQNILFVPDPASSRANVESLFGRLSGGEIGNPFGAADRRSWTFTQTERL